METLVKQNLDNENLVEFRLSKESDFNFIKNSYMKSFRNSFFAKKISSDLYNNYQSKLFDKMLSDSKCLVACSTLDANQILGYCIFNKNKKVIHYVYVKQTFRNQKIARNLINEICSDSIYAISHFPPFTKSMLINRNGYRETQPKYSQTFTQLKYNPYILFEYNIEG